MIDYILRNWESADDPWEEHARWFPFCKYIIKMKGKEYIDSIRRKYEVWIDESHVIRPQNVCGRLISWGCHNRCKINILLQEKPRALCGLLLQSGKNMSHQFQLLLCVKDICNQQSEG
jgi:hypothetical protein